MFLSLGLIVGSILLGSAPSAAAACDALLKRAEATRGIELATAFGDLARCDRQFAESSFLRLMTGAGDAESLAAMSLAAIDNDVWAPVWQMIGKISSYEARDEVADRVGAACQEHPKVLTFLQAGYTTLKDIEFKQWDDALLSCEAPGLVSWMADVIGRPPQSRFDEKYDTLLSIFARRQRAAALPVMAAAAIKAAKGGPYDAILDRMDDAVETRFGETAPPEERKALEDAWVQIAREVGPEKAKAVADRLVNAGAEEAAAKMLPWVYPDRVQAGGHFLYGAAAIELAACKGEKTAVVHWAPVDEPGKRWVILGSIEAPLRAFKAKLTRCTPESSEPWPIAATPEPVAGSREIEAWVGELEALWKGRGYAVSLKEEAPIAL